MAYKQVILVRQDLKLPKGKLAAQVAHASVDAALSSKQDTVKAWLWEGQKKIVLKVADLAELMLYKKKAEQAKLHTSLITDAGHTVLEPGTTTCLGIGPDYEDMIDKITGSLKMM